MNKHVRDGFSEISKLLIYNIGLLEKGGALLFFNDSDENF